MAGNINKLFPSDEAFSITPNDGADLAQQTRSVYVGLDGDMTVDFVNGGTGIVLKNMVAGVVYPLELSKVYASGTAGGGGDQPPDAGPPGGVAGHERHA